MVMCSCERVFFIFSATMFLDKTTLQIMSYACGCNVVLVIVVYLSSILPLSQTNSKIFLSVLEISVSSIINPNSFL